MEQSISLGSATSSGTGGSGGAGGIGGARRWGFTLRTLDAMGFEVDTDPAFSGRPEGIENVQTLPAADELIVRAGKSGMYPMRG